MLKDCHEIRGGFVRHVGQNATVMAVAEKYALFRAHDDNFRIITLLQPINIDTYYIFCDLRLSLSSSLSCDVLLPSFAAFSRRFREFLTKPNSDSLYYLHSFYCLLFPQVLLARVR